MICFLGLGSDSPSPSSLRFFGEGVEFFNDFGLEVIVGELAVDFLGLPTGLGDTFASARGGFALELDLSSSDSRTSSSCLSSLIVQTASSLLNSL